MKTFVLFLGLALCSGLNLQAAHLTENVHPDNVETKVTANSSKFSFTVYGEIPSVKVDYAQSHFLGEPIETKWNTFLKNYTQVSEQSIGFASTNVQFVKPVIYNAVQKVNKYLKKSVVLDCANVACFEPDTEAFEQAIDNAETREDIIRVFQNTELVFK